MLLDYKVFQVLLKLSPNDLLVLNNYVLDVFSPEVSPLLYKWLVSIMREELNHDA